MRSPLLVKQKAPGMLPTFLANCHSQQLLKSLLLSLRSRGPSRCCQLPGHAIKCSSKHFPRITQNCTSCQPCVCSLAGCPAMHVPAGPSTQKGWSSGGSLCTGTGTPSVWSAVGAARRAPSCVMHCAFGAQTCHLSGPVPLTPGSPH